ncbi:MAG: glycosyltransferase [Cyclobacteriaceae bacterium]|nr:glycosyltransferase [Cyclobacteriaceae bacterium]
MSRTALFLMTSAYSHYLPSFRIANQLSSKGFQVVYGGDESFRILVEANGFSFLPCSISFIQTIITIRNFSLRDVVSLFFKSVIRRISGDYNGIFGARIFLIQREIDKINPGLILVDSFLAPVSVIFLSNPNYRGRIIFLQTMLSTYRSKCVPPLSSSIVPRFSTWHAWICSLAWKRYFIKRLIDQTIIKLAFVGLDNHTLLLRWLKSNVDSKNVIVVNKDRCFHFTIDGVPEIILSPKEIDYPWLTKRRNQYYAGISIDLKRLHFLYDKDFAKKFSDLIAENFYYRKVVYCSMGTISQEHNSKIFNFILRLIGVFERKKNWHLILASGVGISQFKTPLPENITIFTSVPQLQVLAKADLFISHGGLNSIVEAINCKVPMLIFPLNDDWDQNGNSSRVSYFNIGRKLSIESNTAAITNGIREVLEDPIGKTQISHMSDNLLNGSVEFAEINNLIDSITTKNHVASLML